ncbi:MAG: NADH:flavin oxidoreductase/NADH oxidase [Rhizobacter sp.]|nr:NADH:flavin oxidoreductase/NADH oxidase [Rhizobacter sp.]
MTSSLFSPFRLRDVHFRNRVMVSPMNQYTAVDGVAGDWHFAHLAQFALGGAGFVCMEATKVERRGMGSLGDIGLWCDEQVPPLKRIVDFMHAQGAVAGIQLNHSGRKAGTLRPWEGFGPLTRELHEQHLGEYPGVGPSAIPFLEGWAVPREMDEGDIRQAIAAFGQAARRAEAAGFDVIELHGAHGYLVHQFLSPLSNQRRDGWGGSLDNRMRFAIETVQEVRRHWPVHKPLGYRISAQDEEGWTLDDSVVLARALKAAGVDVIDCSSGGINARSKNMSTQARAQQLGFQVPLAEHIRRHADMPTIAVGLILHARQAEDIIVKGRADFVALAREMLIDPYWAAHAARTLGVDPEFKQWPKPYGWWLDRREKAGYERHGKDVA